MADAASVPAGTPTRRRSRGIPERRLAWLMTTPSMALIALVAVWPILYAIWLSLHEYSLIRAGVSRWASPAGFGNYFDAFGDSEFWDATVTTLIFTVASVAGETLLGLAMALIMASAFKGQGLLRTVVLVPWAVLTVVTAIMWRSIVDANLGFVNSILGTNTVWLGEEPQAAIVVFCLLPFYWLVNISLKTGADLSSSDIIPPNPSLDNYQSIFQNSSFTRALANSAIVSLVTTLLGVVIGSFAAYALARLKMRFKFILLGVVLSISTFPQIAIAAPLFRLWSDIGLYNTIPGLVIPYLTFALPLSIYILVGFFRQIPTELEEAALVDGATNFQAFRKVIVPLAAPGLATTAILAFIAAWNEFLLATTLTSSRTARTVPVAISQFTGSSQFEVPLGTQSAASVVISIPLVLLVLLFQKRIVAGLAAGGAPRGD